jgi:hypothetical protein
MIARLLLVAFAVGALATGAQAQLVVGSDDTPATIFYIDVTTGMATPLLGGADAESWGMAYDPDTNTLYWNAGTTLMSSPFDMGGLTPTMIGTITFQGASSSMVSLAFRDGMLLGTKNISTEAVYEIDPTTAIATQLYVYPTSFDFGGIGVDQTTQRLFGTDDGSNSLYEIDTGAQTTSVIAPYPAGETDIDGCAAHDGLAYLVVDEPGLFYIYDVDNGDQVGTLTSPFTGSAIFSAAAYVSEPVTPTEHKSWSGIKNMFRD